MIERILNVDEVYWINELFGEGDRESITEKIDEQVKETNILSVGDRSYVYSLLRSFTDEELTQLQMDIPISEGYVLK